MSILTFKQSKREYTEAVGSLYQREVMAYLVALKMNFKFYRSKLIFYKKHNSSININKFDQMFNFLNNKKIYVQSYNFIDVLNTKIIFNHKNIYNLPFHISEKIFSNINIKTRNRIISKFRKLFWTHNKIIKKDKKNLNIVLHIRNKSKGDVIFGQSSLPYQIFSQNYNLPNNNPSFYKNWYVAIIKKILRENRKSKKKIKISICSTGKKADFDELFKELRKFSKIKFFLNIDEFVTFKKMITADHLVLSQSSFSYLASLINCGKKYIRNGFRHTLTDDVKVIKDYDLLNISFGYYFYCSFLENLIKLKLFLINTDFQQIIKNKFKFF